MPANIGFFLDLNPGKGGIYQYGLTMLDALASLKKDGEITEDITVICSGTNAPMLDKIKEYGLKIVSFDEEAIPLYLRVLNKVNLIAITRNPGNLFSRFERPYGPFTGVFRSMLRTGYKNVLDAYKTDLMIYPLPTTLSFDAGIPYVMAVHDLQHRLHPEFPEVTSNGEWEMREYLFRNGAIHGTRILVDSAVGKEDVLRFYGPYGLTSDRVDVLPYLPASYLSDVISPEAKAQVKAKYGLPEQYLFYPAQFWPHKNHLRIVQALGDLKDRHGIRVNVAFSGSYGDELRKKTYDEVVRTAEKLSVAGQIRYLGYVSDADMACLYANATGLIMPTFFGPTNIPPLEAWAFGCPVITSDIRGIREQMEDAAVLVDPRSPDSIADGIRRLWTDEELRKTLIEKGKKRLSSYTRDDYRSRLKRTIHDAVKTLE